ncbi:MAG: hypothetical protein J6Q48_01405 [Bacteroidaceae bacterium]|nr:hypothetical protein [Bacteroidaceae bacterium]
MINTVLETKLVQELNLQEVEAADFYRTIFPKGSLEEAGNQQPGKYNAMVTAVMPDMDTAHILHMHDDLALLNEMRVSDAYMNCISYAGRKPEPQNARFLYAFFVRINLSAKPDKASSQLAALNRYLQTGVLSQRTPTKNGDSFEWGYEKNKTISFIRPTYLLVDHGWLYLCFAMQRPLSMFESHQKKLQAIFNDISKKINLGLRLKVPPAVDILEGRTVVGKGDCHAYYFPQKRLWRVSLDELNECVAETKRLYIRGESKWEDNPKLFPWFLREVREAKNQSTMRAEAFITAAAYAAKGGYALDYVMRMLEEMGRDLSQLFSQEEIRKQLIDARYFYMYDFYWLRRRTREYLSEECGFEISKAKRNGRKQNEHCDWLNKEYNAPKKREQDVLQWFADNPGGTQKKCSEALGISISTVNKWVQRRRKSDAEPVEDTASISQAPQEPKSKREKLCPECGQPLRKDKSYSKRNEITGEYWDRTSWVCDNEECRNHGTAVFRKCKKKSLYTFNGAPYKVTDVIAYGDAEEEEHTAPLSYMIAEPDDTEDDGLPF